MFAYCSRPLKDGSGAMQFPWINVPHAMCTNPCKDDHLGICSPEARLDVTFPGLVALARPIGENVDDWMTTERDRSITRNFVIPHRGIQRMFFEA
jgi:hypothetical protein